MHIHDLVTQYQLNNFDDSVALELIQKIEEGNIHHLSCFAMSKTIHGYYNGHFSVWNKIVPILETLANCPNLESLDMRQNCVGGDGFLLIVEALAKNPNLKILDMSYNELGKYGPATAQHLAQAPKLESLDIRGNGLGEHEPATSAAFDDHNQSLADLKKNIHTLVMFIPV